MKETNTTIITRDTKVQTLPYLLAVFLGALSLSANATLILDAGSRTMSGQSGTISFSQYDPIQGTLVGIILSTSANLVGSYYAENYSDSETYGAIHLGVQAQVTSLNNLGLNLIPNIGWMDFYIPGGYQYQYIDHWVYYWNGWGYSSYPVYGYGFNPGYTSSSYNFGANGLVHDSAHNSLFTGTGTVGLSVGLQITSSISDPMGYASIWPNYPASSTTLHLSYEYAPAVVPEPSTYLAGALLLLPFGASVLTILRKNSKA